MRKIVIFGNSGAGKSTLARRYSTRYQLPHLDLDSIAWQATQPPIRMDLSESASKIHQFIDLNTDWIIEGCYADLLVIAMEKANEIIFLNPGVDNCINNCKNRPWEPHKYTSIEEQNKMLDFLIEWVKQYPKRNDEFSLQAHKKLFDNFAGIKTEYKLNETPIFEF